MSLFEVFSAATAGIVDALIAAEAMRTAILLMSELHSELLRGELQFCRSIFYCTWVVRNAVVVAPPKPWLKKREGRIVKAMWQPAVGRVASERLY